MMLSSVQRKKHKVHINVCYFFKTNLQCSSFISGRPGLEQREIVDKQQLLLSKSLRHQLRQTHPTNYEDVFTSLMLLMPHVREINCQHSNMVVNFNKGQPDVLPPLHVEVFAGDDDDD